MNSVPNLHRYFGFFALVLQLFSVAPADEQLEMARSNGVISPEGFDEYREGLKYFQSLPVLEDTIEVESNSRRSETPADLNRWLNNMIAHHQFTATEVRLATGISQEQAELEVRNRETLLRNLSEQAKQVEEKYGVARVLPYPGGRHPR